MTTGHVFIAVSLDGFIARPNGDIDWLEGWPEVGHDYGFSDFMASVDGLIMGRGTYEKALSFETWPYTKPVVVMSRTLRRDDIPSPLRDKVRLSDAEPAQLMAELDRDGWRRAYVDGGKIIQSFLGDGLISDLILTRIPILLGEGIPLFGARAKDIRLAHVKTAPFASGFVQSHYTIEQ
ncbi:dihydrofolate reductase family protein [Hyphomicrobium sp.]|uniref:dihydrofolate reductase family protein n=1 Tax=Hyphomicrobium sp. TaxID=82 RepID=UPI002E35F27D|nr:dihydrofolate reductase family protein [Hyphomicrobium sp.]HEX2843099.1 dihydrofolate reductase family protein [Hyphomicrobium sp.]